MLNELILPDSVFDAIKAAEAAKSQAGARGVSAVVALAGHLAREATPRTAASVAVVLKNHGGFKAAVAKVYSEKAAQCAAFARKAAYVAAKDAPKGADRQAAFEAALAASLAGLATCQTLAALAAKVRPPKAEEQQAAKAADIPATAAAVFGLLAVWAAGQQAAWQQAATTTTAKAATAKAAKAKAAKAA